MEQLAAEIRHADGRAHTAEVDALDEPAVHAYLDGIVAEVGRCMEALMMTASSSGR